MVSTLCDIQSRKFCRLITPFKFTSIIQSKKVILRKKKRKDTHHYINAIIDTGKDCINQHFAILSVTNCVVKSRHLNVFPIFTEQSYLK